MNRPRSRQAFALKRNVLGFLVATLILFSLFLFFLSGKKQVIEENTSPFDPQQAFEIVPNVNSIAVRNVNECDNQIETISWKPRIFRYKKFISDEQCDYLLNKGKDKIVRSRVVGVGEEVVSDHRTSSGVFLDTDGDLEIIKIEKKISEWLSIPPIHFESFYLLRYQIGEQYKPHYDYFDKSAANHIGDAGQRTATVILCLNPALEGGTTSFPKVNITVGLEKGDALLFYDRLPNGNLDELTLHAGDPVIRGEKWVITKWIRERPYDNNWYSREKNRPVANPNAVNPFTGLPEFPLVKNS